jgi:hypothetical protein
MKMKFTRRQVVIVLAIAALVYFMTLNVKSTKSTYTVNEEEIGAFGPATGPSDAGCEMKAGTGLASSLLPREVAPQEDFGEFAPDDILAGQSFLEPRQQTGYPETLGGALRNANQQIRADPPVDKKAYVWSNSTIVPDTMQRGLCK